MRRESLLKPLIANGKAVDGIDLSVATAKARCQEQVNSIDPSTKRFLNPHAYPAGIEKGLFNLRTKMIQDIRGDSELY